MRLEKRTELQWALDLEMRPLRILGRNPKQTNLLLRAVRKALGVDGVEVARRMGVSRGILYRLERAEKEGTISMNSLNRVAKALNCEMVYAIVPLGGRMLEDLAVYEKVKKLETGKNQGIGSRE
jgi:transcriptional regulator with XRE-family HTH domain